MVYYVQLGPSVFFVVPTLSCTALLLYTELENRIRYVKFTYTKLRRSRPFALFV